VGEHALQRWPGGKLQAVSHQTHTEQEQADTTGQATDQGEIDHFVSLSEAGCLS